MNESINYQNLSDKELLSIVIRERPGEHIAEQLFAMHHNLSDLLVSSSEYELNQIKGIGPMRAAQIKAIYELAKRLYEKNKINHQQITSPADVANYMMPKMRFLNKEHFIAILLNTKNNVISTETISIGTINSSIVHPREVFNAAIRKCASSIVAIHNHPSGDPTPSQEDVAITQRLYEAGKLVGIQLVDHVVIGDNRYVSLKEKNLF